ncbi:aminodeoxychorismate lyase [Candidatus Enterovibrio altilux]|nr:aminodeoxychorismate lyase [Candidatus Enterovibrio luxaltus]
MILLNGQETTAIAISDRGLQYGDGCFTTVLVQHGIVSAWDRHEARLRDNTAQLFIVLIDWKQLKRWVQQMADTVKNKEKTILKVIITRGTGDRSYSPAGCHSPNVVVFTHDYPVQYDVWRDEGIALILLTQKMGISPFAGLKHLNRLEQVMLKHEVDASNAEDGIACDMNGYMIETSASNLFWRKQNTLYTPNLQYAGVKGTMRAQVMEIAHDFGYSVVEITSASDVLWDADEIFITNAIMGLIPVNRIENTPYSAFDACTAIALRLN